MPRCRIAQPRQMRYRPPRLGTRANVDGCVTLSAGLFKGKFFKQMSVTLLQTKAVLHRKALMQWHGGARSIRQHVEIQVLMGMQPNQLPGYRRQAQRCEGGGNSNRNTRWRADPTRVLDQRVQAGHRQQNERCPKEIRVTPVVIGRRPQNYDSEHRQYETGENQELEAQPRVWRRAFIP